MAGAPTRSQAEAAGGTTVDVLADEDMDEATRADMAAWTGCIAGALTRREFEAALENAGLTEVEIRETDRVHAHAGSAIIRARKATAGSAGQRHP